MMEGQELRAATRVWQEQAASESRLELMSELLRVNVGFADLEIFNLGITNKLRSEAMKLRGGEIRREMVAKAMEVKMKDEKRYLEEMTKKRNCLRRSIGIKLKINSKA